MSPGGPEAELLGRALRFEYQEPFRPAEWFPGEEPPVCPLD